MNPKSTTYTTTGVKEAQSLDWRQTPFAASIGLSNTGAFSVTLEGTLDDVNDPTATPVWQAIGSAITTAGVTALTTPYAFIRANIGTIGTNLTMKILQGEAMGH